MDTVGPIQSADRLILSAVATSDSQGRILAGPQAFRLGPAEQGFVYEGTVQIPNAPAGAQLNADILGKAWGQWAGPTNYGPIQMFGGETLQVTGTGFTPNTQYVMILTGVSLFPDTSVMPIPPNAPMSIVNVETSTLLVNGQTLSVTSAANKIQFRAPTLTRRLTIIFAQSVTFNNAVPFTITGDQTGVTYWAGPVLSTNLVGLTIPQIFFAAIEPLVDQTYTLNIVQPGTGSVNVFILASSTNPLVLNDQYMPLYVTFGSGSGTPIPFPTTGNPTTKPFNTFVGASFAVGNTQTLIAAPGSGFSIYLQSISVANGAGARVVFRSPAATVMAELATAAANTSQSQSFPGGLELPSNAALIIDVFGVAIDIFATYVVGPTL